MPRRTQPPRLWLRERRDGAAQWVILDRGRQVVTGARPDDRRHAEKALSDYIASKHVPQFGTGHPSGITIADALAAYGEAHGPTTRRPDLIRIAILRLLDFYGDKPVTTVTKETCAEYVSFRCSQTDARQTVNARSTVKPATARRELVVLNAALRWCWENGKLDRLVPVSLPPQSQPRERHLTRSEAAQLLASALGWDTTGKRHRQRINRHLARFILIGLYTGTRHDAILRLQWHRNGEGGWIDLASGVLHRRPPGAVESGKRRPPVPIAPRLMSHLRRWRGLTARYVIEWHGKPIASKERNAWHRARELAGLGPDILPHTLRHTCATWLLQAGVSTFDVAGVLGTTEDVIRQTYGHHARDQLYEAVRAFSRR